MNVASGLRRRTAEWRRKCLRKEPTKQATFPAARGPHKGEDGRRLGARGAALDAAWKGNTHRARHVMRGHERSGERGRAQRVQR